MFAVSFWQWIMETLFLLILQVQNRFWLGQSKFLDELWWIYVHFQMHLSNAFYLLGDQGFHRRVTEDGIIKAVWRIMVKSKLSAE